MRDLKKNKSVTVTLYHQICRNGCFWINHKRSNNKLIKYERFKKKQIRHYNIIPSDLPKWAFMEQTEIVFDEMETALRTQWNSSHKPKMHIKSRTRNHFKVSVTLVPDLDKNQKRLFIKALIPCSGTQGTPKRPNTFSNHFTKIDHRSTHRCLSRG